MCADNSVRCADAVACVLPYRRDSLSVVDPLLRYEGDVSRAVNEVKIDCKFVVETRTQFTVSCRTCKVTFQTLVSHFS